MNKRGAIQGILISLGVIIAFVALGFFLVGTGFWENITSEVPTDTTTEGFANTFVGENFDWLKYIFGGVPVWLSAQTSHNNAAIIVFAVFILMMVTFADIINMFSTFSKGTSWIAAIAIAIIAANLKAVATLLAVFIGIFSFLGGLAVIVGLGAAFVAFVITNLGVGSFGWIKKRRAMMGAEVLASKIEAGGTRTAAVIKAQTAQAEAYEAAGDK